MPANSFGNIFVMTSFGESHGTAMGVVISGMPAGVIYDEALLQDFLDRRRPGSSATVSARQETDEFEILSGIFEGKTLGTPIAVIVRNQDARSTDYQNLAPRPGHADDTWKEKFGHVDPRGGGRSSGRETVSRVIAGAFAKMLLKSVGLKTGVNAFASQIGPLELSLENPRAEEVSELLLRAKAEGKSYGGTASVWIENIPPSLGQPVFHKLKSELAAAFMSVGATTAFELGDGLRATYAEGSEFHRRTQSQQPYGGIRGGISTGEPIECKVHFKPTSSVLEVAKKGRHDPCIVLRALVVLESMAYLVVADHLLWAGLDTASALKLKANKS